MLKSRGGALTKIAIFYDGNYFFHVSNYYNYEHDKKSRISIGSLHQLIRNLVSNYEGADYLTSRIVDAHYFRGRLNAYEARENQKLFSDRVFEDILMNEGVIPHYLPVKNRAGKREEKGIDVWLALEAYELAVRKEIDVVVMIACDGDYIPLIRKLNAIGTRVMLLSWDFKYNDENGRVRETRTSAELFQEATYPIAMHDLIEEMIINQDEMANELFVAQENGELNGAALDEPVYIGDDEEGNPRYAGSVIGLKDGYGFIAAPPNNIFFHYSETNETVFKTLNIGDVVSYILTTNKNGQELAKYVRKINEQEVHQYV